MQDTVKPGDKWAFDPEVTACFDDMLRRSIPQYDVMREMCLNLASRYVKRGTDILDLGCSRGEAIAPLVDKFGAACRFVGVEVSDSMIDACVNRFKGYINTGIVDIRKLDLRNEYPPVLASVTLSILTLQFTPIEYRHRILRSVYEHTAPGGAFLLVEKVLGSTSEINEAMVAYYYAIKREHGYSQEDIDRKRFSLEGVLVPVTAKWNEELLHSSGFTQIDCFWRCLNFAGWLAIKEPSHA